MYWEKKEKQVKEGGDWGNRNPKVREQRWRRKGKGQRQNEMITWMRWDPFDNLSFPGLSILFFWLGIGSHFGHHCLYGLNDKKSTSRGVWTKDAVQPQSKGNNTILLYSLPSHKIKLKLKLKINFKLKQKY